MTTPTDFTPQAMFDRAYLGVIKQGKPGLDGKGQCDYFVPETGCMCGIGHVVGPDMAKKMVAEGVEAITTLYHFGRWADIPGVSFLPDGVKANGKLLVDLQLAHDKAVSDISDFIPAFKKRMSGVAKAHGLTVPEFPE